MNQTKTAMPQAVAPGTGEAQVQRLRCMSRNTISGKPCRLWADRCPHSHHRSDDKPRGTMALSLGDIAHMRVKPPPPPPQILADMDYDYDDMVANAAETFGIAESEVHRDYWLTRCLFVLAQKTEGTGRLFGDDPNPALANSVCAFAGGTSLVSAWGIASRYSEDLDILCLMDTSTSVRALRKPHSAATDVWLEACRVEKPAAKIAHRNAVGFRQVRVPIEMHSIELKIETTVEDADDSLVAERPVLSLIGRDYVQDQMADILDEHPELGGFTLPCVVPAYTAANKFDALHRRSLDETLLDGLVERGRDLYDLAAIARSPHADDVRSRVAELAERATVSPVREKAERPSGGYGHSPAFTSGTAAHEALRRGYERALGMSWDPGPPAFEDAVGLAAGLDLE